MTASVETLRQIMLDDDISLRRRVEAADQILSFEASVDATKEAKTFLTEISETEVFEDGEKHVDLRLDALKIIRKAEARKVTQPPAVVHTGERSDPYRMAQRCARYELQKTLEAKGLWPAPPGWDAHIISPDWQGPPGIDEPFNPNGMADRLGAARKARDEEKRKKMGLPPDDKN
jgi:hypothetical protein